MDRARIYYSWWGNAGNKEWTLLAPNGELEDYGTKKHCIGEAKKMNWKYQVERWHKKERGRKTIIETN